MPETHPTEPAGIWLRVSSGAQDEQNQLPEDLAWCEAHGYEVRVTYTVHGKSAFKGNKKFDQAWAKVLADLKSGVIRVLVVWKQDRLDRKLATFQMLAQVVEAGGRVEFVTQPHLNDLTTMGGRIALKVEEEIAHAESQTKSDRSRIDIAAKHAAGSLHGRPCWGYEVACTQACGKTGKECKHVKTLRATPEGLKYAPEVYQPTWGSCKPSKDGRSIVQKKGMTRQIIATSLHSSRCAWMAVFLTI
jgi:DNA invertase Pin-like site-specific DNA recombinase